MTRFALAVIVVVVLVVAAIALAPAPSDDCGHWRYTTQGPLMCKDWP